MANEKYVDFTLSGRLVQGSLSLTGKVDNDGKPVMDKNEPTKQVMESFIAVAIHKTDPQATYIRQLLTQVAQRDYPGITTGECTSTHPRFAFKIQDGDGTDTSGQSVAGKPGFAGHWVIKMVTRLQPKCYMQGKYQPHEQLQNPDDIIKKGHYIRVIGSIIGNGVPAQGSGSAVPGLFVSHSLVEYLAPGDEIVTGISAQDAFSKLGTAALPVGAVVNQTIVANMPVPPAAAPPPPVPQLPVPQLPVIPAPPPPAAPAGPTIAPQWAAQGVTWPALQQHGWTEDVARQHGYIL